MAQRLLDGFMDMIGKVVLFVFSFIGNILSWIAGTLAKLATELLEMTIFAPVTLDPSSVPGDSRGIVSGVLAPTFDVAWKTALGISGAVALGSLAWGAFQLHFRTTKGGADKQSVVEGFVTYVAIVIGGKSLLFMMLEIANGVTAGLLNLARSGLENVFFTDSLFTSTSTAAAGYTSAVIMGVVAVLVYLAMPTALLFLAGAILWVAGIWLFRMVDLVFFTTLLPITAAFSITGSKRAFEWNFQEAIGAIFSQMVMAFAWYLAWKFMDHTNVLPSAVPDSPADEAGIGSFMVEMARVFLRLVLGLVAMVMVGRAPKMLQSIAGNSHGGVAGIAMGAAGGMMLARAGQAAFKMSPIGAAVGAAVNAAQAGATARLASWGDEPTAGSKLSAMVGSTSAGLAIQHGLGAVGRRASQVFAPVKRGLDSAYENSVVVRGAAEALKVGGRGVGAAASAVFQPRVTLGQAYRKSLASQVQASEASEVITAGVTYEALYERSQQLNPGAEDKKHETEALAGTARRTHLGMSRITGDAISDDPKITSVHRDPVLDVRLNEFKRGRAG